MKKEIDLSVKSMLKYHIDMIITEEDGYEWRYTGVYGEPKTEEKEKTWENLRLLKGLFDLP